MKRLTYSKSDDIYLGTFLETYEFHHKSEIKEIITTLYLNRIHLYVARTIDDTILMFYGINGKDAPFMIEFNNYNEIRSVFSIPFAITTDNSLNEGLQSPRMKFIATKSGIERKLLGLRSTLGKILGRRIKL